MDEWLSYKLSGEYIYESVGDYGEDYCTFTPNPLLGLNIKVDAELMTLLCNAHQLLGQLEGMSAFLPNVSAIKMIMLQKEAQRSCHIDGIAVSLYNILEHSKENIKGTVSIRNYISTMNMSLEKVKTAPYKNTLLCGIHQKLTLKEDCSEKGQFRTEHIYIGNMMIRTNFHPIYNPTSPAHIPKAMRDLEQFIRREDEIDSLVKAALAHYQFETIHPFMAGNGFVGRIMPYLILADKKILTSPLICLSHYLSMNKVEYFDRMSALQRGCEYMQWIKFFVRAILFAADESLRSIKKWLQIRKKNLQLIERSEKSIKAIRPFYDNIERYPIFDINTITRETNISYNTGTTALNHLLKLGIVKQINKAERYRSFAYQDFLDCFSNDDMIPAYREETI